MNLLNLFNLKKQERENMFNHLKNAWNHKNNKLICIILAYVSACSIALFLQLRTSNILTAIIAILLFYFYRNCFNKRQVTKINVMISGVVGSLYSIFMTLQRLDGFNCYPHYTTGQEFLLLIVVFLGLWVLFSFVLLMIYSVLFNITIESTTINSSKSYVIFIICLISILLCWLPYYLRSYPGIVISDSIDQISQMVTGNYRNHHPVAHTWFMEKIMNIGFRVFGTVNASVAVFAITQMSIMAGIFSYSVVSIYQHHIKKRICIVAVLFYALMPYNVMFSFNIWKDSLFSSCILLFTTLLWNKINETKMGCINKKIF